MRERIRQVRELVARGRLGPALDCIEELVGSADAEHSDEVVLLRADYSRHRSLSRMGLLSRDEESRQLARVSHRLLSLLDKLSEHEPQGGSARYTAVLPTHTTGSVFLSYGHCDASEAESFRRALEERGIEVWIDVERLQAGESIEAFIRRSIRRTDLTFCLVSTESLLSGWVALETLSSFWAERIVGSRRFVAGFLDDGFFGRGFRLEATRRIDASIGEIDRLVPEYLSQRLDTTDLDADRARLLRLRAGLGEILERLRESLALDLREPRFEQSVAKLVAMLRLDAENPVGATR